MQLKLFTLPVKNLDAAEAEMNAFLRSHRVLTVKKELVADGENNGELTESWQDRIIRPKRAESNRRAVFGASDSAMVCRLSVRFCPSIILSVPPVSDSV
jgi:hypothetical protein